MDMVSHKTERKNFIIVLLNRLLEKRKHAQKIIVFDKAGIFAGGALGYMRNNMTLCQLFARSKKTIDLMLGNQIDRIHQCRLWLRDEPTKGFLIVPTL